MKKVKEIVLRMFAVVIASALGTIGAGSLLDVASWKAALIAGIMGVATVSEKLARDYIKDGYISEAGINSAFSDDSTQPAVVSIESPMNESYTSSDSGAADSSDHSEIQVATEVDGH